MYKPIPPPLPALRAKLKNIYPVTFKTETSSVGRMWVSLSVKISIVLLFSNKSDTR